jgi:CRISPR type III-B/RAMP module RAMP protein Cmr6
MTLAVPGYLQEHLRSAKGVPPGHWFRLYFGGWWTKELEAERIKDLGKKIASEGNNDKKKKLMKEQKRRIEHRERTASYSELDDEARAAFLFQVFKGRSPELGVGIPLLDERGHHRPLPEAPSSPRLGVGIPLLNPCTTALVRHLAARHQAAARDQGAWSMSLFSVAPFTTGLGIEHPLENGFAFLDPYGLPYLPGSSVKGVVRRAAEELALFETDNHGWSIPVLWWLFGFDATSAYFAPAAKDPKPIEEERTRWREGFRTHVEKLAEKEKELLKAYVHLAFPPKNGRSAPDPLERVLGWIPTDAKSHPELREIHTRGALEFWDVLPEPKDGELRVDIMNPHYNHYYQQGQPPGDWGSPVPIFFLTLPPGTRFTFVARFRPPRNWPEPVRSYFETPVDGKPRWRSLVESAFAFAFDWLGFGAKTAVGYGRMTKPLEADALHSVGQVHSRLAAPGRPEAAAAPGSSGFLPISAASPELEALGRQIRAVEKPGREQVSDWINQLARRRNDPAAPALAMDLWNKIKHVGWLARLAKTQPVFWDLISKGGGK